MAQVQDDLKLLSDLHLEISHLNSKSSPSDTKVLVTSLLDIKSYQLNALSLVKLMLRDIASIEQTLTGQFIRSERIDMVKPPDLYL